MSEASPKFRPGDQVRVCSERDRLGMVWQDGRLLGGEFWYPVLFGAERQTLPESNLEAYQAERDPDSLLAEGVFGNRETFAKCVTFRKLQHPLKNALYSFRAARTQFHPHQYKPLLKFLDSPGHRLLIADEVGLGKTIEAGYILQELKAREHGTLRRVLIVCPSALCRKWQDELQRRFDEEFTILNAQGFREFLGRVERKGDRAELRAICSIQSLRGRAILDAIEAIALPIDLVVVDEAHHLRNRGTLSNRLGHLLNGLADGMILLTATPIHLGNENLFNLLQILDPQEFDRLDSFEQRLSVNEIVLNADRVLRAKGNLSACKSELRKVERTSEQRRFLGNPIYESVLEKLDRYDPKRHDHLVDIQQDLSHLNVLAHILTRTRKRDVQLKRPVRTPMLIPVQFTEDEIGFYARVTDACSRWYQQHSGDWAACFAAISLQRQMASSIPAFLEHSLDSDQQLTFDALSEEMSELALEDWAPTDDSFGSGPTLRQEPSFQRLLHEYRDLLQHDSKYEALRAALRNLDNAEPGRKLIIFSYFKRTLAYLEGRLRQDGYKCIVITGDVPANPSDPDGDERSNRLKSFRDDGDVRILLSSEVGSEGLDFQFCHILANYDLPWNPMVVEQRIGRLDRLGQMADRIVILNFSVHGTIEERILQRLYDRIRIFEGAIGDLEPILGEEIKKLTETLIQSRLTPEEQDARITEVALVLERRQKDAEKLEKESGRFLGHDEFFDEQIARVLSMKRYLTADELHVFVSDFLYTEHPRCNLKPAKETGCYWLTTTLELTDLVRQTVPANAPALPDFLSRARTGGILVTFDSDAAFEANQAELINSHHPLTRSIVQFYEDHPDRTHPVAKLRVATHDAPASDYVYYLHQIEVRGIRPGRFLEAIFVAVDRIEPLAPMVSERLLAAMLAHGASLPEQIEVPSGLLGQVKQSAEVELAERLAKRKNELMRINGGLLQARLASLTASYEIKRNKHEEMLRKEEAGKARDHYLRLLRGGLRNIEAAHEQDRRELEEAETVDVRFVSFAAGVVRVELPSIEKKESSHAHENGTSGA